MWYLFYLAALIRGLAYPWPYPVPVPPKHASIMYGLMDGEEAKTMYRYGWIPWAIRDAGPYGVSRQFIVKENNGPRYRL